MQDAAGNDRNSATSEDTGLKTRPLLQLLARTGHPRSLHAVRPAALLGAIQGPGDAVGTTATFTFASTPDGRTRVRVTHGGWPHDEANFIKCNTIWGALVHHLREYVESGVSDPAFA